MSKRYVLIGASSGLGATYAAHLDAGGASLITVSRRPAAVGRWVAADVTTDEGIDAIADAVGDGPLDGLLYLGGTWEAGAFTDDYDFARAPRAETRRVIAVNLVAPILCAQVLAQNLAQAPNPRIVMIGALSGLDRSATREVANTASKFGLRGAAQALTLSLRDHGIGVTVINPGNIATPEVLSDIAAADSSEVPIPLAEFCRTLDYVLSLSREAVPDEIQLAQSRPGAGQ